MARTGLKTQDMRNVSFRMPTDVHQDYVTVAQSRGVDLTALLNWVLIEFWPVLLLRRAEHGAAMLRAVGANLPQTMGAGPNPEETLAKMNEVIGSLQAIAAKLSAQLGGRERRQAG
jgi:hypothetical protein